MKSKHNTVMAALELLMIIACILVVTYAWFSDNKELRANDLTIATDPRFDLLVSTDNGANWTTSTSLNLPEDFQFKNEITANGVDFFFANTKRDDGTPITFTRATINRDYLEFDILFKLNTSGAVFINDNSYIQPTAGVTQTLLIGDDVERVSSSGDFSRDLIASSVRVAFIENDYIDETYVPKSTANLVWAPNKNYEISCPTSCIANLNSTSIQDYRYIDASIQGNISPKPVHNLIDDIAVNVNSNNAGGNHYIAYMDRSNDGIKKVTVRVWIEGNDRDNVTALTGGIFKINLEFTALIKQLNNIVPNVIVSNNSIYGYASGMEYSIDNGLTWTTYDTDNNPTIETGTTAIVRYSETSTAFASEYITLNF